MPYPQCPDRRSSSPLTLRRLRTAALLPALALFARLGASAQTALGSATQMPACQTDCGPSFVRFTLEPRDSATKAWAAQVDEHGNGSFAWAPQTLDNGATPIRVSRATRERTFAGVPAVQSQRCESHSGNVAQMGRKSMLWRAGVGTAACTFNYSDDPALNDAAAAFQAIAETMRFGGELARLRRFDRLGLDAELDLLQEAVGRQYAIELENIAPTLDSIAHDERVIERARRKAARLLATIPSESAAGVNP